MSSLSKKPVISIIIPAYNSAKYIRETLDSILNQTIKNWECIIVDDLSIDNTEELVKTYINKDRRFTFFKRPNHYPKGANTCRNLGLNKSNGSYIKFLDSDDILLKYALDKQLKLFNKNVDVVVCKLLKVNFEEMKIYGCSCIQSDDFIISHICNKTSFYVSGPLWRSSFLFRNDLNFDTYISNLDDWDFNLRALYKSPRIILLKECLVIYRKHKSSLSSKIKALNEYEIKSELYARKKHLSILKAKNNLYYKILASYYRERLKKILALSLSINNNLSKKIFIILIKEYYKKKEFIKMLSIICGFLSYKLLGRGYKFLK